jgi:DNA-binding response OmpR family regulator
MVRGALLLVEDDDVLRGILEIFLAEHGFDVHTAVDGEEALELIISDGLRPAVIVLDLCMPHLNGWDLLEVLDRDRRLATVPRIVLTAVAEPGVATGARTAVLPKPFACAELVRQLERFCEGAPA